MAKIDPRQVIQRRRTEDEMRQALHDFICGNAGGSTPPQDDDTDIILNDCIEELLEARKLLAEIRQVSQIWLAKAPKR
jgi:hypothetical protein